MESLTLRDALIIGLGQTLALVPGFRVPELPSPSAWHRPAGDATARFSFLLSIPAVAAAAVFPSFAKLLHNHDVGISALLTLDWPLWLACQDICAFDGSCASSEHEPRTLVIYRVALGLHFFLPPVSRGRKLALKLRPYHYDGHPCGGFPPTCPARFARPSRPDLLRLSPQGQTPTWTGQGRIGFFSCSC